MPRRSHNQAHENQTWKLRRILRGHPIVRRVAGQSGNRRSLNDVTRILESIEHGDPKAADELLPLVYGELTSNRFPLSLSDPFSIPLN